MRKERQKGFTLIELIVVIAIIGILAGILVPTMMGYVRKSKRAADVSNARGIHTDVLDLLLENDEAHDSFYDKNVPNYSSPETKTDAISGESYGLVVVAYLDGTSRADGSGKVWTEVDSRHHEFCDLINSRMDYSASNSNIKMKIKSNSAKSGEDYNRWFVGYRKERPSTVEVWVGDGSHGAGGDPQLCLYTQINKTTNSSDG
ncbi:MAG: prepilin-type N-terminal cleavage/methylation domain-containing protein [Ruminococcus sp.]|nr:prepilin-type N-terminal cleavage/methylation domain-containing protein [Ruminococcus sp.]